MEKKYLLRAEKSLVHYSGLKKDFKKPCVPNSLQPRQTVFGYSGPLQWPGLISVEALDIYSKRIGVGAFVPGLGDLFQLIAPSTLTTAALSGLLRPRTERGL